MSIKSVWCRNLTDESCSLVVRSNQKVAGSSLTPGLVQWANERFIMISHNAAIMCLFFYSHYLLIFLLKLNYTCILIIINVL